MKLVIDERVKHRLIGLAVILSIAAIFAPAIMKKSSQRLDGNMSVSVELPPKPAQPDVALTEKNAMFDNARVAHVEIPDVTDEQPVASLAQAEPLSQLQNSHTVESIEQNLDQNLEASDLDPDSFTRENQNGGDKNTTNLTANTSNAAVIHKIAKAETFPLQLKPKAAVVAKNAKLTKPVAKAKLSLTKPKSVVKSVAKTASNVTAKGGYSVQLATFTQQSNADALISRLKLKGYKAIYAKVKTNEGLVYKVMVGQMQKREQAQLLQKQLASAVQIKGFIVMNQG